MFNMTGQNCIWSLGIAESFITAVNVNKIIGSICTAHKYIEFFCAMLIVPLVQDWPWKIRGEDERKKPGP